jgi:hypothetical protein
MSVVDILNSQLGPEGIAALGQQLGLDPATTQKAVAGAVPLLTGALARNASQPAGAQALNRALDAHDGSILDQITGYLGNSGAASSAGEAILGHVLGGRRDNAAGSLAQASGINMGTAAKLLALLAPLVMGALGRSRQQSGGFDPGILGNILSSERDKAAAAAPAGMGGLASMLDLDGDGNPMDDIARMGGGLLGGLFGDKR